MMRQAMRSFFPLAVLCVLLLQTGCSSYCFCGSVARGSSERATGGACKYRLSKFDLNNFSLENWTVRTLYAASVLETDELGRHLMRTHPSLFSSDGSGVPIRVTLNITSKERKNDALDELVFFLSFLVVPCSFEGRAMCQLQVALDENPKAVATVENMRFEDREKISGLFPLGLFMKGCPAEEGSVRREGRVVLGFGQTAYKTSPKEVCLEALSAGIVRGIGQLKRDDVQRANVLNQARTLK